jgi:small subunit ribosomal protein S29
MATAMELTMAHTAYAPLPESDPVQYIQKNYISTLLSQILSASNRTLSKLEISQEHQLPIPLQSNITLSRLAELGVRDPEIAWPVFYAFWTELSKPSTAKHPRPPILIAIDGLRHIMRPSEYRDPEFNLIHSHDLAFVKLIVDYLSGTSKLPNGGAVLAATSASSIMPAPTFDLALEQGEARTSRAATIPQGSPFKAYDERVLAALKYVEVTTLKGLTRQEARGLMEYYAASGVLRESINDRYVSEKWTIASGGIVGELEKSTLRIRG